MIKQRAISSQAILFWYGDRHCVDCRLSRTDCADRRVLFQLNKLAYGILFLLTVARAVRCFPRMFADLISHSRGPGLLTMVAGTCILGSQFVVLDQNFTAGFYFWLFGILLWCILMYAFLTAVIREGKPDLEAGLNGDWLITVVATQSVSLLGTPLAPRFGVEQEAVLFLTLCTYLLGCVLYILIISLIFYRLTFFALTPEEFTPSYWVNMGAVAITTLAGSVLVLIAPQWSFPARNSSLRNWIHSVFLAYRDMVDPFNCDP